MKSDMSSRRTSRLVLPAALAVFVAFGITQSRMVAIDAHQLGDASISAGHGQAELRTNLGNTHRYHAPNLSTDGSRFGKIKNLYALVAAQFLDPIPDPICETNVTQGGWGYTNPTSITNIVLPGRASFGGSATGDRNGLASGQEQYSDPNFDLHSVVVFSATCLGTQATIMGQARVTKLDTLVNQQENFQIDVDDQGEPGNMDTYRIQLFGDFMYDSGPITLQGGNVQVK
jgi:hypothetical protein